MDTIRWSPLLHAILDPIISHILCGQRNLVCDVSPCGLIDWCQIFKVKLQLHSERWRVTYAEDGGSRLHGSFTTSLSNHTVSHTGSTMSRYTEVRLKRKIDLVCIHEMYEASSYYENSFLCTVIYRCNQYVLDRNERQSRWISSLKQKYSWNWI